MERANKKILTLPIRLALITLITGALFKVMHWSFSKELLFFGATSICILYLIRFFNKRPKLVIDYVKLAIVLLWIFSYLSQVFHLFNIPYVVEIAIIILILWWIVECGFSYFKNRKFKNKGSVKIAYYSLVGLALIALLFGVLFKIQHWPYGSELFVIGTVLVNTILVLDYFLFKREV